ncbi:MAG TPA: cytochrome c4 [Gammaproteobacteria bacterium]|nr:cytochrome c4 [Gammaproteobacteria bacterium]
MKNVLFTSLVGFALFTAGSSVFANESAAAGDPAAGKTKSQVCAGCHGGDGNSANPDWPKLAGQHPKYLVKQLMAFKSGDRKDPTMSAQAANLSEQDMKDLAAYFSSQKVKAGSADEASVALGEAVYRGGNSATGVAACIGCHGPRGTGNPAAKFPSLSGQHAKYTEKQLKAFQVSGRANDAGKMMRNTAVHMTEAEIKAVAQYISGLH